MASIPKGAQILTLEEALGYFPHWSPWDRNIARSWVEKTGVTDFYVPPAGGYVAGHGGPNRSAYRDMPVNGLLMHVGFLHAWPNNSDVDRDVRIELSNSRGPTSTTSGSRTAQEDPQRRYCPRCNLAVLGHVDECESCGYDFAAARAASMARWHEARRRQQESAGLTLE